MNLNFNVKKEEKLLSILRKVHTFCVLATLEKQFCNCCLRRWFSLISASIASISFSGNLYQWLNHYASPTHFHFRIEKNATYLVKSGWLLLLILLLPCSFCSVITHFVVWSLSFSSKLRSRDDVLWRLFGIFISLARCFSTWLWFK